MSDDEKQHRRVAAVDDFDALYNSLKEKGTLNTKMPQFKFVTDGNMKAVSYDVLAKATLIDDETGRRYRLDADKNFHEIE